MANKFDVNDIVKVTTDIDGFLGARGEVMEIDTGGMGMDQPVYFLSIPGEDDYLVFTGDELELVYSAEEWFNES